MRPVPRVPPFDRPALYEDLEKLAPNLVAEIVDGQLHTSPRPGPRHARAETWLAATLGPPFGFGRGGPGGWQILIEPELHLGDDVLVPDLAGWRLGRMPALPETAFIALAPDWICEVLSPSTATLDREKKLAVYARERAGHAWLVDPIARCLEVLRIDGTQWAAIAAHTGDCVVRVEPFDLIELELGLLWAVPGHEPVPRSGL